MTAVTREVATNQALAPRASSVQGKHSGWLGTSCGLCLLAALTIAYIPAVLPFILASLILRAIKGA